MRSSGGTNLGLDGSVVACTNLRIACLAGPSFQDGKGSVCAATGIAASKLNVAASAARDAITPRRERLTVTLGDLTRILSSQSDMPEIRRLKRETGVLTVWTPVD